MAAKRPGGGLARRSVRPCSASQWGLRIMDRARMTDCRGIRRSTALPDYGLRILGPGGFVSGQSSP
eukprot:5425453-Alexandrium_andersonii.AAC.1